MTSSKTFSRRSVIAGLLAAAPGSALAQTPQSSPDSASTPFIWPEPISIHDSIQILDWRPFPSPDHPRFIAEIKNIGDEIVDAPTIGLTFPEEDSPNDSYSWGTPWNVVLLPGQSTFLFGPLDPDKNSQEDLDNATWIMCEEQLSTTKSEQVPLQSLEWSDKSVDRRQKWGIITATLTNHGEEIARFFAVTGVIRDSHDRIAGGSFRMNISKLAPQESQDLTMYAQHFEIEENWVSDNPANQYHLLQDGESWTIDLAVDARRDTVNAGCPAVMPWNR